MKRIIKNPLFPIIIAPIILFSPLLFSGKALFWGTPATQFVPWWDFAWASVMGGEIPLWNPWLGLGTPLVANYQSAIFYPPYWIYFVFYALGGVTLMAWSITIIVIFHLTWAGIGTAKLLKSLDVGKLGQTIGGLAFSLSGYLVSRAGFLSVNAAVAWIPWLLLLTKGLSTKRKGNIWLTGLVFGFQLLAGHAQTTWYTVLLCGMWITYWAINSREEQGIVRKTVLSWGRYAGAGLLGVSLSAIQIFPTIEYLQQSQRALEFGFEEAMTYSFWPWRFLTLLVPDLFGTPVYGNYWGYGNFWEDAVYIGLLPILLAIGLSIRSVRSYLVDKKINIDQRLGKSRNLVIFLTCIIGISFLFALGKNTLVFPFLYRNIPSFDLFQAPTRFTIWAEISLALLAGIGIDSLRKPIGIRLYWTRLAAAGSFAVTIGAVLAWQFLEGIKLTFIRSVGVAGLFGLGIAIAILLVPEESQEKKRAVWNNIVIGLVALDLIVAGWGLNPGIDLAFYTKKDEGKLTARVFMDEKTEYELKFKRFFTFDSFYPDTEWEEMHTYMIPNLNILQRVEMVNNYDPIIPGRYQIWMEELNNQNLTESQQMLDLMGISTIIKQSSAGVDILNTSAETGDTKIRLIGCAVPVDNGNDALGLVLNGKLNFHQKIIIENRNFGNFPCNQVSGEFRIVEEKPRSLKLSVDLDQDSWIFWSQSWYPGWRGTIGGSPVEIYRANYLFQAIYSPAGHHEVVFKYQPISFLIGASTTAAGILIITSGLILLKRKRDQGFDE